MKHFFSLAIATMLSSCASPDGSTYWNLQPCQSMSGKYDEGCLAANKKRHRQVVTEYFKRNPNEAKYEQDALEKQVGIGMPENVVILAWGKPERVNETVTATGTTRQMVYKNRQYVYTRNGRVSAIQDW